MPPYELSIMGNLKENDESLADLTVRALADRFFSSFALCS